MSHTQTIPVHVGIILDGNRRWARANGMPTLEGHRKGYGNLKAIVRHAKSKGVKYLSAYIFSVENWKRTEEEVSYLMNLALNMATKDVKELHQDNVKVCFLGRRDRLSDKLLKAIDNAEEMTKNNTGGTLALCFNYGGQQEIVDSVNSLIADNHQGEVTTKDLSSHLYGADIPEIDLIIRTSGEQRLSNFMLWRAAYSEFYFVDKHWPEFSNNDFDDALEAYAKRDRRFGGNTK